MIAASLLLGQVAQQEAAPDQGVWLHRPRTLHEKVAVALGWLVDETRRFSLQSLRELVRSVSPALAEELTDRIQVGSVILSWMEPMLVPSAPTIGAPAPSHAKAVKRNGMAPFRYPTADPNPYTIGQRVRVQIVDLSLYGLGAESLQQLCGEITRHNVSGGACIEEQYLVCFDTPQPYPNHPDWEPVTHFWFPKCDLEACAS